MSCSNMKSVSSSLCRVEPNLNRHIEITENVMYLYGVMVGEVISQTDEYIEVRYEYDNRYMKGQVVRIKKLMK